ncbi:MAG: S1 RNA-binding domain-containing protein [Bacilli bacterium]|jgi:predicted RNA-binding protein with RPS1 domain|nr:S1 RNA-binding domain-containing protein [Bacilli bacterium]NLN80383.1 S1 RNA-binding domain-containing protein [Erysipelotrichia bacterium]
MNPLYEVGRIIEGTVLELRKYGAILVFEDETRGLLHISEISDRYIHNIERFVQVGRTYHVKIIEINEEGKFLKVSLKQITMEERLDYKTGVRKRFQVNEKEIDFSPLEESLPKWTQSQMSNIDAGDEDDDKS